MVRGILPEEEVKAVGLGGAHDGDGTLESLEAGKYRVILGSALATELAVKTWATVWCSWRPMAARRRRVSCRA